MRIDVREADVGDMPFIRSVFFATMGDLIDRLFGWGEARQEAHFAEFFRLDEAFVIVADGRDVGWIQEQSSEDAINVGSLYIAPDAQRQGVGGTILERVCQRALGQGKAVTVAVVKTNPALHFYERHRFQITHEDEYKFYMRREP